MDSFVKIATSFLSLPITTENIHPRELAYYSIEFPLTQLILTQLGRLDHFLLSKGWHSLMLPIHGYPLNC